MRGFLVYSLFAFISLSCNETEDIKQSKNPDNSNTYRPADFVCNYSEYKSISQELFKKYALDHSSGNRSRFLTTIRDSLFTCWLGTPWDFNGTTEQPNNGKIACGYFVTTLLRDMGVAIKRIKHAQCASEEMIKAVCKKNSIRRSSNEGISGFMEKIHEPGLYIVGLDFHTGFILHDGIEKYFIHANYTGKKVVEKEIAVESTVLAGSKYKVLGKVI